MTLRVPVTPVVKGVTAERIVAALLDATAPVPARSLLDASVRLPPRGHKWLAVYTGVEPGKQVWKSTGLTDRSAAMAQAKEWEAQARRRRAELGLKPRRPSIRVRRRLALPSGPPTAGAEPLSQREAALILKISERSVRAIEHRALEKLRRHPDLREFWAEFATGRGLELPGLEEGEAIELTPGEVAALMGLARNTEEEQALRKLFAWLSAAPSRTN